MELSIVLTTRRSRELSDWALPPSLAARLFADEIVCRTATHQHVEMQMRFMLGISTRA